MEKGLLIILSGPSGVGKGTVRKYIQSRNKVDVHFSVSMTTRAPRANEVDGVDYYFVSKEEFLDGIKNDKLLEYAEFVGNYYGTPREIVEDLRNKGVNVLLEIEITGATQVMNKVKDDRVVSFFLMPPSIKRLEERIRARKSESEEVIKTRLDKGKKEMKLADRYDYIIVNDRINRAGDKIISILLDLLQK